MSKKSFTVYFGDGTKDKTFTDPREARARVLAIRNARVQDDSLPVPLTKKEQADAAAVGKVPVATAHADAGVSKDKGK